MLKPLKSVLTATMLSAVAITPVATVSFIATADIAEAKGKKDKADRGKRSSKAKKGGKPTWADQKTKKSTKSKGGGASGKGKAKKMASASDVASDCDAAVDECTPDLRTLHPSELGNMNGALNANENAILAHIRKIHRGGEANGPIGHMAALAIAGYDRDMANELLGAGQVQEYSAVEDAIAGATDAEGNPLGFESYADYQDYLDGGGAPVESIDNAVDGLGQGAIDDAVANSGYGSLTEYQDAKLAGGDGFEIDPNIELALSNAGKYDPAAAENVAAADGAAADYEDAMAAMQHYWNKGDIESDNSDDLAAMLEGRLDSYQNVGSTIEEHRAEEAAVTEGETFCEEGDLTCETDETALLDE